MAIFNFLKKKKEPTLLLFENISEWLDKYVERQELGTSLAIMKRELLSKIKKLQELLDILENAQPANSNVYPERAILVMEGNKKAYLQKIRNFIDKITPPEKYDEFKPFYEKLSEDLEALATDTQKNFFILKEFIESDLRLVANKLRELDKLVASSREQLENTALEKVKHIKNKLEEFYAIEQEVYELRKKIENLENIKLELFEKRNKIESKIKVLKEGKGYSEYEKLKEKLLNLKESIKETETKIKDIFTFVETPLKKYENKTKNKLAKEYLSNKISAFMEDKEFKIIELIQKMQKEVEKLELKPAKKEKFLKTEISEKELKSLREEYEKLLEEKDMVSNRLKNHSVKLNIKEQEGWVLSIDEDISREVKKIEEIEYELERKSLSLMKQKIRDLLRELDETIDIKK